MASLQAKFAKKSGKSVEPTSTPAPAQKKTTKKPVRNILSQIPVVIAAYTFILVFGNLTQPNPS